MKKATLDRQKPSLRHLSLHLYAEHHCSLIKAKPCCYSVLFFIGGLYFLFAVRTAKVVNCLSPHWMQYMTQSSGKHSAFTIVIISVQTVLNCAVPRQAVRGGEWMLNPLKYIVHLSFAGIVFHRKRRLILQEREGGLWNFHSSLWTLQTRLKLS